MAKFIQVPAVDARKILYINAELVTRIREFSSHTTVYFDHENSVNVKMEAAEIVRLASDNPMDD